MVGMVINCGLESLIIKPSVLIRQLWNVKEMLTYFYLLQRIV